MLIESFTNLTEPSAISVLTPALWKLRAEMIPCSPGVSMMLLEAPERRKLQPRQQPGAKKEPAQDMAEPFFQEKYRTSTAAATVALLLMLGAGSAAVVGILRKRDVH